MQTNFLCQTYKKSTIMKISIDIYSELKKALSGLDLNKADSIVLAEIDSACQLILDNFPIPQEDVSFWKSLQQNIKDILSKRGNEVVTIKVSSVAELIEKVAPIFGVENTAKILCSFPHWNTFREEDLQTINDFHKSLRKSEIADKLFHLLCKERCRRNPTLN